MGRDRDTEATVRKRRALVYIPSSGIRRLVYSFFMERFCRLSRIEDMSEKKASMVPITYIPLLLLRLYNRRSRCLKKFLKGLCHAHT